eukprot:TRINITY_DN3_c0_g1_i2.p1 TRINITY_DN3_c0_g1~~TRINITY_DN3_c0_g1_i2.p1  ORF type:complete len:406 (+),score=155.13 TRINITY_DN3_c0_g1_i2:70-1287(+)
MPHTAYIVECVRTAGGKKKGQLSGWHPADLGAKVLDEVVMRSGVPPAAVDDVVVGCVSQIGSQAGNIGRTMVLSSKVLPETVPGTTVDRQCGSSQQALHFAAQAVMSGTQDVVIAAGVEVMSLVPIGSNIADGLKAKRGNPFASEGFQGTYSKDGKMTMPSQFGGAELLGKKYGLERAELDAFGAASHQKAARATAEGAFKREIVPVLGTNPKTGEKVVVDKDEGIRPTSTVEALQKLKVLAPGGMVTAATSSQITDAASAVLVCNEKALAKYGLKPRAKIVTLALAGSDPIVMLEGPIPASQTALAKSGLTINDMDLYEVNEAFAPVPVAWLKALKGDPAKLNVNGGAIALGHALGSTGTRCMTTLVNALERTGGRYGIQAICEGGGTANATIIERVSEPSSKL